MTTQREKDIDHWQNMPSEESHSETFADGAAYARKQVLAELRALGYGQGECDIDILMQRLESES